MQVDEAGNMIIARILGGSTAARQELLKTGEVILEVNSKRVRNPEELQQAIQDAKENLSLKLAPGIASETNQPLKSTVSATSCFSISMPLVTTVFSFSFLTVFIQARRTRRWRRNHRAMKIHNNLVELPL